MKIKLKTISVDYMALFLWGVLVLSFALLRKDYSGDGLRHLYAALASSHLVFGEARWLYFPTIIYAIVHPLHSMGWVNGIDDAILVFVVLNISAGLVYLIFLRKWLMAVCGGNSNHIKLALIFAAISAPMLTLASDINEPLIAAAIVVAGFGAAAARYNNTGKTTGSVLAILFLIFFASLIYQGAIFSVFLLPCAIPFQKLFNKRTITGGVSIVFLWILAYTITSTAIIGKGYADIFDQIFRGEANVSMRSFYHNNSIYDFLRALAFGPQRSIVRLPIDYGIRSAISTFANNFFHPNSLSISNMFILSTFLFSWSVLFAIIIRIYKQKRWSWLAAFVGLTILPVLLRNQQYAYMKFYVFFPALLALGAVSLKQRFLIWAICITAGLNFFTIAQELHRDRILYSKYRDIYSNFDKKTCGLTKGWALPYSYEFEGTIYSMIGILGREENDAAKASSANRHKIIDESLEKCFCQSNNVITNDYIESHHDKVGALLNRFNYPDIEFIKSTLWNSEKGENIFSFDTEKLYVYSFISKKNICESTRDR